MSLPSALITKLAKRGLITNTSGNESKGFDGCPNKYNVYHECTKFCEIRWKANILIPNNKYLQKRERMLKKYPLPLKWKEIYDRGWFYYWDTENNLVSWLPPKHPASKVSFSAAYLRLQIKNSRELAEKCRAEEKRKYEEKMKSATNKTNKINIIKIIR